MARSQEQVSPTVKYTLFISNLVFWAAGGLILGVGLYARLLQNDWDSVTGWSTDPAILMIVGGAVTFVLGFCGSVGSLREHRCLLKVYAYGLVFMILLEIAAGVVAFLYQGKVKSETSRKMRDAIIQYHITNQQTDLDDAIEAVQQRFDCCGADRPRDWPTLNKYYTCTREYIKERLTACSVPPSCCKKNAKTDTQCGYKVLAYTNMTAAERSEYPRIDKINEFIYTKGCSTAVIDWVKDNYVLLGSIALAVLLVQVFGVCFAISMIDQINFILQYDKY